MFIVNITANSRLKKNRRKHISGQLVSVNEMKNGVLFVNDLVYDSIINSKRS